jgi:hypothetical protein
MKKVAFGIAAMTVAFGSAFATRALVAQTAYVQLVRSTGATVCKNTGFVCNEAAGQACQVTVQLDTTPPTTPVARAKNTTCATRLTHSSSSPIGFYDAPETDIVGVIN